MASAWRAVQLAGLTDELDIRNALVRELARRDVVDATDTELDGLVILVRTPTPTMFGLLRSQAKRTFGLLREMRTYAEPRWALPAKSVPTPPEPDLTSTEVSVDLTPADLAEGRPVLVRLLAGLVDQGEGGKPERDLTPWLSTESNGVNVHHVGGERIAVIAAGRAAQLHAAIERWGQNTGKLSVHGTLRGDQADTASLRVFVSLPTDS